MQVPPKRHQGTDKPYFLTFLKKELKILKVRNNLILFEFDKCPEVRF
jgi:hypothetical protein